ncbi:tetraspanin-5-like [Dunckerocampus dactyliophorus]|uniref:tetraspanin-5-like n=1 Tax=Dunckerocampus dactyliophorus TaxID=161453 RepID=UPI002405A3D8|nr:tetraspanin-5-like [Dunckerocampus dactyliophorus]
MALDLCGILCKYTARLVNMIVAVLGFAFLGLGLWLRFSNSTRVIFALNALNSSTFVIGVTVLIVLGTLMLIVVTFGLYGECSEKKCALQVFSVLVFILALADVAVGGVAYTRRDQAGARVEELYNTLYTLFASQGDLDIGVMLTFIHELLHCCGVTRAPVVELVRGTCPEPRSALEEMSMPRCSKVITEFFNSNATVVMAPFIVIGLLLITALVCTIILLKQIKKDQKSYSARYSAVY